MSGIQAIRNCEGIEHADVSNVKLSGTLVEVSTPPTDWDGSYPSNQSRGNSGVVRMQAQRACGRKAVDSYERECSFVRLLVGADEMPLHKACICVEHIRSIRAGFGVCARSAEFEINLAYNTVEIRYGRRISSLWMGAQGVG